MKTLSQEISEISAKHQKSKLKHLQRLLDQLHDARVQKLYFQPIIYDIKNSLGGEIIYFKVVAEKLTDPPLQGQVSFYYECNNKWTKGTMVQMMSPTAFDIDKPIKVSNDRLYSFFWPSKKDGLKHGSYVKRALRFESGNHANDHQGSKQPCSCDIQLIMSRGCQCGGI